MIDPESTPSPPQPLPHWEVKDSFFSLISFFITAQEVLFHPAETFRNLHKDDAIQPALVFGVAGGTAGALLGAFWQSLAIHFANLSGSTHWPTLMNSANGYIAALFVAPFFFAVSLFMMGGLVHLGLKLMGGAHQPFAATFKVLAYASGATALLAIVPILGSLTAVVWTSYLLVAGLRAAHGATAGQVVVAIFLPFAAMIGLIIAAILLVVGLGLFALFH